MKILHVIPLNSKGEMPIYEPGLKELVTKNLQNGNLKFTSSLEEGVNNAEIIFICVGTPMDIDGRADLKYVYQVSEEIAKCMKEPKIISITIAKRFNGIKIRSKLCNPPLSTFSQFMLIVIFCLLRQHGVNYRTSRSLTLLIGAIT